MNKPVPRLIRHVRVLALMGVCAVALTGCASMGQQPSSASEAQAQRLGALFEQTLPVKDIVSRILQTEPKWPFQQRSNKIRPAELACVRAEMAPEKITVQQHENARRYAKAHPERLAQDIQLLESGAASAMNALIMDGVNEPSNRSSSTSERRKANAVMKNLSAQQKQAMLQLLFNPDYSDLRKAMRIDFIPEAMFNRADAYRQGARVGAGLLLPPLMLAMQKCQVTIDVLE